jgi:hypothetical protein
MFGYPVLMNEEFRSDQDNTAGALFDKKGRNSYREKALGKIRRMRCNVLFTSGAVYV